MHRLPGSRTALRWVGILSFNRICVPNLVVVLAAVSNLATIHARRRSVAFNELNDRAEVLQGGGVAPPARRLWAQALTGWSTKSSSND